MLVSSTKLKSHIMDKIGCEFFSNHYFSNKIAKYNYVR